MQCIDSCPIIYATREYMRVAFIGMPCSGKSTIAAMLASRLQREFADSDKLVQIIADMSIQDMFDKYGHYRFRELETEAIVQIVGLGIGIVSLGGGAILSATNMSLLSQYVKIFLNTEASVICDRYMLSNIKRPLYTSKSEIEHIYSDRLALYTSYADIIIDNSTQSTSETLDCVMHALQLT